LSGSSIGVVYDTPINIALNGGLSCGSIKLCPATQGAIHIIYGWDVSKVTNMKAMFHHTHDFNQDVGSWDISSLTDASGMFEANSMTIDNMNSALVKVNSVPKHSMHISHLTNIPTANVLVKVACMIKHPVHISHLTNIPTANVLVKVGFEIKHRRHISHFNQDVGSWDISSLTDASGMFEANSMTIDNMNSALRGWAKLDTAAGETAIQSNELKYHL
jgi:hypothetical protein